MLDFTYVTVKMNSRFMLIHEIVDWCNKLLGPATKFADGLSPTRPWYFQHEVTHWGFYFFRESDAVLFTLRWGGQN